MVCLWAVSRNKADAKPLEGGPEEAAQMDSCFGSLKGLCLQQAWFRPLICYVPRRKDFSRPDRLF